MYPVSDDFKKFIYDGGRELHAKVGMDLAAGTHLALNDYDLLESGFEVEDAVSDSNKFQVGAAIINQLTLILNNFEDKFSSYDFSSAMIRPSAGLVVKKDWHGDTLEWVPRGVFTAEKPTAVGSRITITALDNMSKLDIPYSKSKLTYPATLGQIAADACSVCGVTLATTAFPNSDYAVAKRPSETSITCREILSYVAQLAGCFARCDTDGAVEIRWYAENETLYDVGNGASSSSVADADTIVTGVQIQGNDDSKTIYSSGTDEFAVRIQSNPLAQDNLQAVANALGTRFIGFTFRAYTVSSPSNPAIEAGDIVNMTDKKGITHKTIISRLTYEIDGNEEYNADAETTTENQSERFTAAQKAQEAADNAQQTADDAADGVAKAEIKIGNLEISIQGKVSFSDLSGDGTTEINGKNIVTGRISSEDGSWWLDLETGEVFMKKGTFAGDIKWLQDDGETVGGSITYTRQGGLHIDASGPMSLGAGSFNFDGPVSMKSLNDVDVMDAPSGSWNVQMEDGSSHRFYFDHGILTNVD